MNDVVLVSEAFDHFIDPICVARSDGSCRDFNRAWRRYAESLPQDFASDDWANWIHRDDRPALKASLTAAIASGATLEMDVRLAHPADMHRWFLFRAHPHTDETGTPRAWLYILTDIHRRKLFKLDLAQKSRIQADMLNASLDCIKVIERDGTLSHMNKAGCIALDVPETTGFGMDWISLLPEEVHAPGRRALEDALNGTHARFAGISSVAGGPTCHWDNMLTPLMNADDEVEAILCVSRDVTAERESEHRIKLLLHELNHRSKNMLSVMQALIRRSVPDPSAEFVSALERRIASMARSQDLLIDGQWTGAKVREIIAAQTAVAGDVGERRLDIDGDADVRIGPKAAEVLGLALHELATNAIKYGAFSNESGTVSVTWAVDDTPDGALFRMRWAEAGGPPVSAPSRKGFGTIVIERNPAAALKANVRLRYHPDGLIWELQASAASILAPSDQG